MSTKNEVAALKARAEALRISLAHAQVESKEIADRLAKLGAASERTEATALIPRKVQEIQRLAIAFGILAAAMTVFVGLGVMTLLIPFEPLPTPQRARTLDPRASEEIVRRPTRPTRPGPVIEQLQAHRDDSFKSPY